MRLDIILRVASKFLIPFILLFALYVQFHGDFGPGGGFQAGVIAAATVILYSLIFGLKAAQEIVPFWIVEIMVSLGVLIYAGVGFVAIMLGGNYLDYNVLGHDRVHAQELGVFLVEVGVFVTVCGTMVVVFYLFAGRGRT